MQPKVGVNQLEPIRDVTSTSDVGVHWFCAAAGVHQKPHNSTTASAQLNWNVWSLSVLTLLTGFFPRFPRTAAENGLRWQWSLDTAAT